MNDSIKHDRALALEGWYAAYANGEALGVPASDMLRSYINHYDIVFAIIGGDLDDFYLIKGRRALEQIAAGGRRAELNTGAVPVHDHEEAVAMARVYGDAGRAN